MNNICYWCDKLLDNSEKDYNLNNHKCRCKIDKINPLERLFCEKHKEIEVLLDNK